MHRRLQRRDPRGEMSNLEAAVNNLFDDRLSWGRGGPDDQSTLQVDVLETASRYEIIASVPGLQPEDITVSVLAESVRIASDGVADQIMGSERKVDESDRRWLVRERYVGRKERTITLPSAVLADDVTASFQDGVLRVILPKADTAQPRRIEIRSGSGVPADDAPIDIADVPRQSDEASSVS